MKKEITKETLEEAAKVSYNYCQVCRALGRYDKGGSYEYIKSKLIEFNIDCSHFTPNKNKLNNSIDLVKTSRRKNASVLRNLLNKANIEYKCVICNNNGIWNNEPLALEIDHIDNNWKNNSIDNLRFLCPNCHTQKSQKELRQKLTKIQKCNKCECILDSKRKYCDKCLIEVISQSSINKQSKNWPTNEELKNLIFSMPMNAVSKKIGISECAIKKRCRKYNIELPPSNLWRGKKYSSGTLQIAKGDYNDTNRTRSSGLD